MGYLKNPSPWERGKLNSRNSRRFIRDRRRDSFSSFLALWEGRKEWICRSICKTRRMYRRVDSTFPENEKRPFAISKGKGTGSEFWNVMKLWKRPYSESRRDGLVRGGGFTHSIQGSGQAGACDFQAKPVWEAVWSQTTAGAGVEKLDS